MLGKQDTRCKSFGGVTGYYSNLDLPQHRSVVEFHCHQMYAAPAVAVTCINRAPVGFKSLIFGEQRRVDVEHPALPFLHKGLAQYPHIARECDIVGTGVHNPVVHHRVMDRAVEMPVRLGEGGDTFGGGELQAFGIRIVAGDEHDFVWRVSVFGCVEQRGHVGAGAGDEDGDAGFTQNAPPKVRSPRAKTRGREVVRDGWVSRLRSTRTGRGV